MSIDIKNINKHGHKLGKFEQIEKNLAICFCKRPGCKTSVIIDTTDKTVITGTAIERKCMNWTKHQRQFNEGKISSKSIKFCTYR